ncbi:polysaccharide deacetylase family protein [Tessaracoccus sp. OH4464_COT-324]|uniref:polysaccharide deacetylase family protein n=1 Tax=Tessaracoccus sp. OH4464_COT-324 TaxID=2491059 RepID=UPI000F6395A0|nr:polysaccharide deacetylase family protein [Tessaracoccus sp. OH4464_COT-324]RRD46933.1 polysaccharide deacetylase family protein [Tessaracoccus sp. OH4464_COT-324]
MTGDFPPCAIGNGKPVALTFDDGPNPGCTNRLLDLLATCRVTATFCVVGSSIRCPGGARVLRRISDEGHLIVNHSNDFADLARLPAHEIAHRLLLTNSLIREALGADLDVTMFRAPNGSWGTGGRVAEVAASLGMAPLGLGRVIYDWRDEWQDACRLTANLRAALTPGAVVLAHDGGGDRTATVEAFERVLGNLDDGWTFVRPTPSRQPVSRSAHGSVAPVRGPARPQSR